MNFQRSLAVIIYSSICGPEKRDVHLEYSRAFFDVVVTYLLIQNVYTRNSIFQIGILENKKSIDYQDIAFYTLFFL